MIGIGLLSAWMAVTLPTVELSSPGRAEVRLPSALLESRLALCELPSQKKGCEAAFRYLEEAAGPNRGPSSSLLQQPSKNRLATLKTQLKAGSIPENEWVGGAINAWLLAIDPHAKLASADEADRRASADKIYVQGAGAKLRFHKGKVFVGYSMEGSAAERAGLRAGDRILALNGRDLATMNETTRRRWLSQTKSPYHLKVERAGRELKLEIRERRYYLANVEGRVVREAGKREGLIRVRSFDKEHTCSDIRRAIDAVESAGARTLRLDLRDNPGGLVREAQCAAGLFLGRGKIFARLKRLENAETQQLIPAVMAGSGYGDEADTQLDTETRQLTSLPLTVEINQNSASAAEMLAASLQDNGRARVTGARSFGKGSMQSVFHPWADERLYLTRTTHAIYRASGQLLNLRGVTPDEITQRQEGENFPRERELTL